MSVETTSITSTSTPLTALSYGARLLLSSLLNPTKVLPSDNANRLPRDWHGLAALVGIPSETLSDNGLCQDKTLKVLEIWQQKKDGTATLENLKSHLQVLDRYDICDDLEELSKQGKLIEQIPLSLVPHNSVPLLEKLREDFITKDDVLYNSPQTYHAYVVYAKEDQDFVDELLTRMTGLQYKICTEHDLLPGFHSQFGPISTLISERCHKIILVYSEDFFRSSANKFFLDYVQADGIESKRTNIIPCMYRQCELPHNHRYYHMLYYTPPGQKAAYDFWERLAHTLHLVDVARLSQSTSSQSSVRITEVQSSVSSSSNKEFLTVAPPPYKSHSENSLNTHTNTLGDSHSVCDMSGLYERTSHKKISKIKKFFNSTFSGKKQKKKVCLTEGS